MSALVGVVLVGIWTWKYRCCTIDLETIFLNELQLNSYIHVYIISRACDKYFLVEKILLACLRILVDIQPLILL